MATAFETEMGVLPELSRAVSELGWILPTDIQSEAIPQILGGRDVLLAAETGSGKTGAFCLPILQIVSEILAKKDAPKSKINFGGKWAMNLYDRGNAMAIDNETGRCQSRDSSSWHGCRSKLGVLGSRRWFYEVTVTDEGLCRVGWATMDSNMDLGTDKNSYGFGGTGKKSFSKQFDTYGEPFGLNDVIGCFLDLEANEIKWSKNGKDLGKAFNIAQHIQGKPLFPSICLKNAELEINFGEKPFSFSPKGNFVAICSASKEETISSSTITQQQQLTSKGPLALIIEPIKELAEQTHKQIELFKKYLPDNQKPSNLLVTASIQNTKLHESLKQGVDIVVGTVGKLNDLITSDVISLANCRFLVLDECDGLLSQNHRDFIHFLHQRIPKVALDGTKLQVIICSATLHNFDVKKLAENIMQFPLWIDLKGEDSVPETVHHVVCMVDPSSDIIWKQLWYSKNHIFTDQIHHRDQLNPACQSPEMASEAVKILKGEYVVNAITKINIDRAIIFCRTKVDCDNLEDYLIMKNKHKFSCVCLHSGKSPNDRTNNFKLFKEEKVKFLICTDVAARGLDISGLPYVINVTLPDDIKNYVHRIGRVGRAERMGLAISLVSKVKEKVWYHSNCQSRGKDCSNSNLVEANGCAIWYNELDLLNQIEEHLKDTITQIDNKFDVPVNEFDGKVVYGQKLVIAQTSNPNFEKFLLPASKELSQMEKNCQDFFLSLNNSINI